MGAQPGVAADRRRSVEAADRDGEVRLTRSRRPRSSPRRPPAASVGSGDRVTITGTAADSGGGIVAGVEVSVDGGATWHAAQGTASWTYDWTPGAPGAVDDSHAAPIDDSGNREVAGAGSPVTIVAGSCPCPTHLQRVGGACDRRRERREPGRARHEVPERRQRLRQGRALLQERRQQRHAHRQPVDEHRHAARHGARSRRNRRPAGRKCCSARPVPVAANTTYVVSYHTNVGHYSASGGYFTSQGVDRSPLHAPATGTVGGNGVYVYGASAFPTQTFNATNYWVDVRLRQHAGQRRRRSSATSWRRRSTARPRSSPGRPTRDRRRASTYSLSSSFPAGGTITVTDGAFVTAHSVR